jgi:hypothetical protein
MAPPVSNEISGTKIFALVRSTACRVFGMIKDELI